MNLDMNDNKVITIVDKYGDVVELHEEEVDELFYRLDEKYFHIDVRKQVWYKTMHDILSKDSLETLP